MCEARFFKTNFLECLAVFIVKRIYLQTCHSALDVALLAIVIENVKREIGKSIKLHAVQPPLLMLMQLLQ